MEHWVPLAQSLVWISLILYLVRKFSSQLEALGEAIRNRIASGSSFKAGPVELGADFNALEKVEPAGPDSSPKEETEWSKERDSIYSENSGIFLAHIIEPSSEKGQDYDIFIYLVRHKFDFFDDIEYAEFFLGSYWGNHVYKEVPKNGLIGLSTSAYGPFLCTCRVKMKNGKTVHLNRYIDFEMGRVFEAGI